MQIAYYDESGDDGFPQFSSPLFVLSYIYFHHLNWKPNLGIIQDFRRDLKANFGFPIRLEMHTNHFLLNKGLYKGLGITDDDRLVIVDLFCDLVANINLKIINVVIIKPRIKSAQYKVLDTALKYSVQRIENDLNPTLNPDEKFMIITDPGRVGKMVKTTRRIQRINFIPSKFGPAAYRREITSLIEDPLQKDSKESYFIQLADLISYVVYLYSVVETGTGKYPVRLAPFVDLARVTGWMEKLKPNFNLSASPKHIYGIVYHPQ